MSKHAQAKRRGRVKLQVDTDLAITTSEDGGFARIDYTGGNPAGFTYFDLERDSGGGWGSAGSVPIGDGHIHDAEVTVPGGSPVTCNYRGRFRGAGPTYGTYSNEASIQGTPE